VKGSILTQALEHCIAGGDHLPDCHIAGVEVWYDSRKEAGKRIIRTRLANGKSVEKDATYTLVVSDFMATGGSGFAMLAAAPREDIDIVDLDALIRYVGVLPAPVEAPTEPRFHRTDQPGSGSRR
jgi:5'-nucleotidase